MADTFTLNQSDSANANAKWIMDELEKSPIFSMTKSITAENGSTYATKRLVFKGNAGIVPEGGKKPPVEMEWEVKQLPVVKAAFYTAATMETVQDTPNFVENLRKEAVAKLEADIAAMIAGELTTPVGFDTFGNANIAKVELVEGHELAAVKTARKVLLSGNHVPSDVLAAPSVMGAIAMSENAQGVSPFENADSWYGATVHTSRQLKNVAIMGDFKKAVFSPVGNVIFNVATTGSIPNPAGGPDINLLVENKIGFIVELRFVWGIEDESAFVLIEDKVDETP